MSGFFRKIFTFRKENMLSILSLTQIIMITYCVTTAMLLPSSIICFCQAECKGTKNINIVLFFRKNINLRFL